MGTAVELVASSIGADGCALGVVGDGDIDVLATTGYRPEDVARWPNVGLGAAVPLAEAVRQRELVAFASPDELGPSWAAVRWTSWPTARGWRCPS